VKNVFIALCIILTLSVACSETSKLTAEEIVKKSINYHDPNNNWKNFSYQLEIQADIADGTTRSSSFEIDNSKGYFRYIDKERNVDIGIEMDSCFALDDKPINCERTKTIRNYWVFLTGLPMKLLDEGTALDSVVVEERFEEFDCFKVKVQYPKDVWYFYIDKQNFAFRGKAFYKDEAKNRGEKMILTGEVNIDGLKLSESRKWINTHDSVYLATDRIINFKKLNH
jgi:hypothetical protein